MTSIQPWPETSREAAGDFKIFQFERVERVSPRTGNTHQFVQIKSPDWINILPITSDGQAVFIHQYRHGTDAVTMEIPGGMVDPHEADPIEAARREMLEETGFSAETILKIGVAEANPAFMTNRCHTYLALNAVKIEEPQFDGTEDIATELVPLDSLNKLVMSGKVQHSLVICAIFHFNRWRESEGNAQLL